MIDDNPGDAIRPAGLRNGVAGLTPAAAGWTAMASDVRALIAAGAPATRVGLMVSAAERAELVSVYDPADGNLVIMPGAAVPAGMVIVVDLDCFASCTALPQFEISTEAVLHEATNPLVLSAPRFAEHDRGAGAIAVADRCGRHPADMASKLGFAPNRRGCVDAERELVSHL